MGTVVRVRARTLARRAFVLGVAAGVSSCGGSDHSTPSGATGGSATTSGGASSGGNAAGAAPSSGGASGRPSGDTGGTRPSGGTATGGASAHGGGGEAGDAGDAAGSGGIADGAGGENVAVSGEGGGGAGGAGGDVCPFLPSKGLDVSARLAALSSPIIRPPTLLSTTVLDGTTVIQGELTSKSERTLLLFGDEEGCEASSTELRVDVHAFELVGDGPHQVAIESYAGADVVLAQVYQSLQGEAEALDLDAPCAHWLGSVEEWTGAGYRLVASGLARGTMLVAVGTSSSLARKYSLTVSSSTSCSGTPRQIEPGVDAASTPFVDPNPMACTESELGRCEAGVNGPSTGEWVDCCLVDLIQNPEGKCGLSGNGSACVERQQPGNVDESCPAGTLRYSFPPNTLQGDGYPCCNWRTGLCGLMNPNDALNLGCSPTGPFGASAEQPCTPDYSAGILF